MDTVHKLPPKSNGCKGSRPRWRTSSSTRKVHLPRRGVAAHARGTTQTTRCEQQVVTLPRSGASCGVNAPSALGNMLPVVWSCLVTATAPAWTASERSRWVRKMGAQPDLLLTAIANGSVRRASPNETSTALIPAVFDSASHWPHCAKLINDIRDQGNCGCCWAFAGVSAASDRACIASNGALAEPLSAGAVCFSVYNGCGGGDMRTPWMKIQDGGIVTGGQSNNSLSDPFAQAGLCYSYPLPHCRHHTGDSTAPYPLEGTPGCPDDVRPATPTKCDASAVAPHNDWSSDGVTFDGEVVVHQIDEAAVQRAILAGGPVAASMEVYSDFPACNAAPPRSNIDRGPAAAERVARRATRASDHAPLTRRCRCHVDWQTRPASTHRARATSSVRTRCASSAGASTRRAATSTGAWPTAGTPSGARAASFASAAASTRAGSSTPWWRAATRPCGASGLRRRRRSRTSRGLTDERRANDLTTHEGSYENTCMSPSVRHHWRVCVCWHAHPTSPTYL